MEEMQKPMQKSRSSVLNIPTDLMAALVFCIPAAFGWIPVVGYFAWILPMYVFMAEKKSNFVRFCASESLCICIVRLVFSVVFDGIYNVALRTVALYGSNPDFVAWWGDISNPGHTAHTLSIVFAVIFTVLCAVAAFMAYRKKLLRVPIVCNIADYMTKELKPVSRHTKHHPAGE